MHAAAGPIPLLEQRLMSLTFRQALSESAISKLKFVSSFNQTPPVELTRGQPNGHDVADQCRGPTVTNRGQHV